MRSDRLLLLARVLDGIPERLFDLTSWFTGLGDCDDCDNQYDCGTVACAVGWACRVPAFHRLGLSSETRCGVTEPLYHDPETDPGGDNTREGWDAVEQFFGLSQVSANYLFSSYQYNHGNSARPSDVAARIRDFVASGGVFPLSV